MAKSPITWRCFNIESYHLQKHASDCVERLQKPRGCCKWLKGERFGGSIMNHHGIKQGGLEQLAQPLKQVQVDDQSTPPSSYRSFIAYGGYDEPYAPALKTWKALRDRV